MADRRKGVGRHGGPEEVGPRCNQCIPPSTVPHPLKHLPDPHLTSFTLQTFILTERQASCGLLRICVEGKYIWVGLGSGKGAGSHHPGPPSPHILGRRFFHYKPALFVWQLEGGSPPSGRRVFFPGTRPTLGPHSPRRHAARRQGRRSRGGLPPAPFAPRPHVLADVFRRLRLVCLPCRCNLTDFQSKILRDVKGILNSQNYTSCKCILNWDGVIIQFASHTSPYIIYHSAFTIIGVSNAFGGGGWPTCQRNTPHSRGFVNIGLLCCTI